MAWQARRGAARRGEAWPGEAWLGKAGQAWVFAPFDSQIENTFTKGEQKMTELQLEGAKRISRDLRKAMAGQIGSGQARYLVDLYYEIQTHRIRMSLQKQALEKAGEPNEHLDFILENFKIMEKDVKTILDLWTDIEPSGMGKWAKGIVGIGPVLSAGLLAHIDITKAPTVGHIWRFAGLDPTVKWEKGQKRPWNAKLKVICWKIGESFEKVQNHPDDIYGKVYKARKMYEQEKNERREYAEQAAEILQTKKIGKDTEAYKWYSKGMLPPAHIRERAKRYAVKLFLSHWHHEAYRRHYGEEPPKPYPIAILGHAHYIAPPEVETA